MKRLAMLGVGLFIFGIVGLFLTGGFDYTTDGNLTVDEEKTLSSEHVETVTINVDIGKVTISEHESDDIHVRYRGNIPTNRFNFAVEREEDHAQIVAQSKRSFFSLPFITYNWNQKRNIDIMIPKNELTKIVVNGDATNISAATENVAELDVKSAVGKISITKFHGARLKVHSDVGSISVLDAIGNVDIRTHTGKVDLMMAEITQDIRLRSDVGAIDVGIKKVPESLVLDVDSDIGQVNVSGFTGFDNLIGKPLRASKGEGGPLLDVKTDVGSITIEQRD